MTFRHFLLLLEIDYQKFLSLGVALKIRSDHPQGIKTEITQRIYSGSSKGTMTGFIGATPIWKKIRRTHRLYCLRGLAGVDTPATQ